MKKLMFTAILTALYFFAASQDTSKDWANFAKYAEANKTARTGAKAVFIGNSITEGWVRASPDFFKANDYIGRGISGQVTSQMLARMQPDVIELRPQCVVILAGTNDLARNQGYVSVPNIVGNIKSMAELARAHNIAVVLCSVLPVYQYRWRPEVEEPAALIIQLNALLREYAAKEGFIYVDYHSSMKDERNGLPEKYAKDGVHPTPKGYALMQSMIRPAIERATQKYPF